MAVSRNLCLTLLALALELLLRTRDRVGRNRVLFVSRNLCLALVALTLALGGTGPEETSPIAVTALELLVCTTS